MDLYTNMLMVDLPHIISLIISYTEHHFPE